MRALRGRLSGLAQPTYVLDIPGGHGKVPVGPSYLSDGATPSPIPAARCTTIRSAADARSCHPGQGRQPASRDPEPGITSAAFALGPGYSLARIPG